MTFISETQASSKLATHKIIMTKLDDHDLITTLYQDIVKATVPFIFITTKLAQIDICKSIHMDVNDYCHKPCTLRKLLALTATRLEKQALIKRDFEAYAQQVLELLFSNIASIKDQQPIFQSIPLLRKVFNFIDTNYNQPIGINDVARAVGYSPAYLTNLIRRQTGKSLYRWITYRRIAEAYFLLLETDNNLEQIANNLGYQNVANFHRQFRQINGKTPKAWRTTCRYFFSSTQISTKQLIFQSQD